MPDLDEYEALALSECDIRDRAFRRRAGPCLVVVGTVARPTRA